MKWTDRRIPISFLANFLPAVVFYQGNRNKTIARGGEKVEARAGGQAGRQATTMIELCGPSSIISSTPDIAWVRLWPASDAAVSLPSLPHSGTFSSSAAQRSGRSAQGLGDEGEEGGGDPGPSNLGSLQFAEEPTQRRSVDGGLQWSVGTTTHHIMQTKPDWTGRSPIP
ncbi:hypothetical protein LX32DRAFT_652069 [Colletotrichum zoysiae]|uniref:Uncharacterized protein n=1 Tax=Colletotrichum zoysiae TaxID=1216348 RepID=A0AAD9HKK0_9PEZI|nr:hypothetical protein LX32DRAFT_652069 [Colletotrichum zoysiae]